MPSTHFLPNIINGGSRKRTKLTVDSDKRNGTLLGFRNTVLSESDIEFIASYIASIEYYPTQYANRHTGVGFSTEITLEGADTLGVNYKLPDIAMPIHDSSGSIVELVNSDGEVTHFLDESGNLTGSYYDANGNVIPADAFAHSDFDNMLLATVIQKQNNGIVFANAAGANTFMYLESSITPVSLYGAPMSTINVSALYATDTLESALMARVLTGFSAVHITPRAFASGLENNPAIAGAVDTYVMVGSNKTVMEGNPTKIAFYQSDTDTVIHDTPLSILIKWILPKLTVSAFPGGTQPRGQLYYISSPDHIVSPQSLLFYPNDPEGIQADIVSSHRNVDVITLSTNTGTSGGDIIPPIFATPVITLKGSIDSGAPSYDLKLFNFDGPSFTEKVNADLQRTLYVNKEMDTLGNSTYY